jgi:hypothetical protein
MREHCPLLDMCDTVPQRPVLGVRQVRTRKMYSLSPSDLTMSSPKPVLDDTGRVQLKLWFYTKRI